MAAAGACNLKSSDVEACNRLVSASTMESVTAMRLGYGELTLLTFEHDYKHVGVMISLPSK